MCDIAIPDWLQRPGAVPTVGPLTSGRPAAVGLISDVEAVEFHLLPAHCVVTTQRGNVSPSPVLGPAAAAAAQAPRVTLAWRTDD